MATTHNVYTVGTTAIAVTPNKVHAGMDITIQSINSSGYIYVGGEGVTSSSYGYRLLPNHAISFELPGNSQLYIVGSDAGMTVAVLRMGLEEGS